MNTRTQLAAIIFTSLSVFTAVHTQAADGLNIKPGLWEIQHKSNVNGQDMPDMEEMMANVPPEMRKQMEAAMAQQGAGMGKNGMTVCITAEQIARGETGAQDPNSDCKMLNMKQHGNTTNMSMQCTQPKAEGDMEVTRVSETEWHSKTQMRTREGNMNMEARGKWLGADCGKVKPAGKK